MARRAKEVAASQGPVTVSRAIEVRDSANAVIGRARAEIAQSGPNWVWLRQTYGGSSEGTLSAEVKCDLDVLRAIVEEADKIAEVP